MERGLVKFFVAQRPVVCSNGVGKRHLPFAAPLIATHLLEKGAAMDGLVPLRLVHLSR
jgi:hypothetical protein